MIGQWSFGGVHATLARWPDALRKFWKKAEGTGSAEDREGLYSPWRVNCQRVGTGYTQSKTIPGLDEIVQRGNNILF